jgi:hypothetical protein
MKNANLRIYVKFYKNESKTTIYLSYKNVKIFKIFQFHLIVFSWYLIYHEFCQFRNVRSILQLIKDVKNEKTIFSKNQLNLFKVYSISINNTKKSRRINNYHRDYIYAIILIRLTKNLKKKRKFDDENQILNRFETFVTIKILIVSNIVKWSILRFLIKEERLKKYNKINAILKSLQCALTFTRWQKTFVKNKDFFALIIISANFISTWMKFKNVIINLSQMIELMILRMIKTFNLILNQERRIKFALEVKKHIDEYVVFEELKISNQRVQTKKDSRVYFTDEMWRDIVKRQL